MINEERSTTGQTKNKYARADPDYTPNNYDLTIDKETIRKDLPLPNVIELNRELEDKIPFTKKIHIIMDEETQTYNPVFRFTTSLYTGKGERLL